MLNIHIMIFDFLITTYLKDILFIHHCIHLLLDTTIISLFSSVHCATLFWYFSLLLLSPVASWKSEDSTFKLFILFILFLPLFLVVSVLLEHVLIFEYLYTILISYSSIFILSFTSTCHRCFCYAGQQLTSSMCMISKLILLEQTVLPISWITCISYRMFPCFHCGRVGIKQKISLPLS